MCATRIVENPREKRKAMNKSISEIPVTISALSMGIFVTPIISVRYLRRKAWMPIAPAVPRIVAISADKSAISSVVYRAVMIWSS